jgi:tyrosyl-tRNA synthetase
MKHLKALSIETNLNESSNENKGMVQSQPKTRVLWGVAPTGEPHLGYTIFIHLLKYLKTQGFAPVILIADYHAYLDNQKVEWNDMNKHTKIYEKYFGSLGFEVVKASDFYTQHEYNKMSFKLSTKMDLQQVLNAGYPSLEKSAKHPSVSDVLCVTSQIIDPVFLGAGVVLCGKDEAPIYQYGLPLLEKEFGTLIYHVYSPMCPGLLLPEMHASLPYANNILLSDSREMITTKINLYFNSTQELPPLVNFCLETLFPLVNLEDHISNLEMAIQNKDRAQMAKVLIDGIVIVIAQCKPTNTNLLETREQTFSPLDSNISMLHVINSHHSSLDGLIFKSERIIKSPVFVVGCPRSGTTVIGKCLMQHPQLAGDDESLFILDLWRIFSDLHGGLNTRGWAPLKSFIDSKNLLESMGKLIDSVFLRFQSNGVNYIDHTPWYVSLMPFINLIYPDARFIHVIRNGIDIVNSLGVSYEKGFTWAGADITTRAALWSKLVTDGINAKALLGDRYIEVHYENLCHAPLEELTRIIHHLGLEWHEDCLVPLSVPHAEPSRGKEVTLASSNAAGELIIKKPQTLSSSLSNNWALNDVLSFEKVAGTAMRLSGYPDATSKLKESLELQCISNIVKDKTVNPVAHPNALFTIQKAQQKFQDDLILTQQKSTSTRRKSL